MAVPAIAATRPTRAGVAAAATAVVFWGLGNVVAKHVALGGTALAFYRLWIGAALFCGLVAATGGRLSRRTLVAAAPGGATFGVNILLFFVALKLTTVADASIIVALQPALLLFVAGRFGERVTSGDVVGTVVAIAGVGLVLLTSDDRAGGSLAGNLLAVAALVTWAWYFVASKRTRETMGALEYQAALTLVAAVVVTPFALASPSALRIGDAATLGYVLVMVLVPGGGHFLMNWAHAYAPITLTSLLNLAVPVVAAVGAAFFLGEALLGVQVVGIAVALGAVGVVLLRSSRRAALAAAEPGPPV